MPGNLASHTVAACLSNSDSHTVSALNSSDTARSSPPYPVHSEPMRFTCRVAGAVARSAYSTPAASTIGAASWVASRVACT